MAGSTCVFIYLEWTWSSEVYEHKRVLAEWESANVNLWRSIQKKHKP